MFLPFDIPLDPDAETARDWVTDELAKSDYGSSSNDWLSRILEWLNKILTYRPDFAGGDNPLGIPGWIVMTLIMAVILAVAIFLVLVPVRSARQRKHSKAIFDDDPRGLAEIENDALAAAAAGDWSRATLERFRAIVRGCEDSGHVAVTPGMTASEFSLEAAFKTEGIASELDWAADTFDGLRYAHSTATRADYERMTALETRALSALKLNSSGRRSAAKRVSP